MGLGYGRRRARPRALETLRFGDRPQRTHPPGDEKDRGQFEFSHRDVDRVSAARARNGAEARADESGCWKTAERPRHYGCDLQRRQTFARGGRRGTRLSPGGERWAKSSGCEFTAAARIFLLSCWAYRCSSTRSVSK